MHVRFYRFSALLRLKKLKKERRGKKKKKRLRVFRGDAAMSVWSFRDRHQDDPSHRRFQSSSKIAATKRESIDTAVALRVIGFLYILTVNDTSGIYV